MTTAGDPAPTAIEPRTPVPYRGIGAAALVGAAICIIVLAVQLGASPHAPVTPWILALALGVDIGVQFGIWGFREHRLDQREAATRLADEARYTTWIKSDDAREQWQSDQFRVLGEMLALTTGQVTQVVRLIGEMADEAIDADEARSAMQQQIVKLSEQQETLAALLTEQRGGRLILQIPNQEIYELGKKVGGEQSRDA